MRIGFFLILNLMFLILNSFNANKYEFSFLDAPSMTLNQSENFISMKELSETSLATNVTFDDSKLVKDNLFDEYYISVNERFEGGFNYPENVNVYWVDDITEMAEKIQNNHTFKLLIVQNNLYEMINIKLTTLPIISITSPVIPTEKEGDDAFIDGFITTIEPNITTNKNFKQNTYKMEYRLRGNMSLLYPKKPFKVQLLDADNEREPQYMLGLRSDDDWNLTPAYLDKTLLRENTVFSLYHDLEALPSGSNVNSQSAVFTELFINDEYRGVYSFVEPMDAQQVNLNDETDYLYKSYNWDLPLISQLYENNYSDEDVLNIQVQDFPLGMDNKRYNPLIDFYNDYYFNYDLTYEEFETLLDSSNYIDNYIMKIALSLKDNDIKNLMLVAMANEDESFIFRKEYFDFNSSLGDYWDGSPIEIDTVFFDCTLEYRLTKEEYVEYLKIFSNRYNYLRKNVLSAKNIIERVDENFNILKISGAYNRDHLRWGLDIDIDYEYERLVNFVNKHLIATDDFVEELLAKNVAELLVIKEGINEN